MPDSEADALATYDLGKYSLLFRPRSFDKLVIREIWKWDEYFLSKLRPPTTGAIVDVGAHIGAFAVKAHLTFPGCPLLALEPVSENFRLLEQNLSRNGCSSVTPLNVALAAESGTIQIYLDPKNTAGHSTAVRTGVARTATATTLPDLLVAHGIEQVYLLKIDCEGGEYEILQAAGFEGISGRISNLVLEYHPVENHDFEELRRYLERLSFVVVAEKPGYLMGQGTVLFQRSDE